MPGQSGEMWRSRAKARGVRKSGGPGNKALALIDPKVALRGIDPFMQQIIKDRASGRTWRDVLAAIEEGRIVMPPRKDTGLPDPLTVRALEMFCTFDCWPMLQDGVEMLEDVSRRGRQQNALATLQTVMADETNDARDRIKAAEMTLKYDGNMFDRDLDPGQDGS